MTQWMPLGEIGMIELPDPAHPQSSHQAPGIAVCGHREADDAVKLQLVECKIERPLRGLARIAGAVPRR